jgi:Tfp pilus assembly protein PilF
MLATRLLAVTIRLLAVTTCIAVCAPAAHGQAVPGCGSLQNAYGPFDYRDSTARRQSLPIVEQAHFTTDVEMLAHGNTGTLIGDLDYTLRAFPNHPRALQAVARYGLTGGHFMDRIPSVDCYFQRALTLAPDDATVQAIYGSYLAKRGDVAGARTRYEEALRLAPDSGEINYNAGLFFVQQHDLARAKALADVAYEHGYPLPGLRRKIAEAEAAEARPAPASK